MNKCTPFNTVDDYNIKVQQAKAFLGLSPTADVVEVVRCKDCKYFKMAGTTPRCTFYKGLATTVNPPTDYCSYGERREG